MALNETWHLRNRSRDCAATQTPFQDGEKIITALFPDPNSSGYLRRDYSQEGWKNRPEEHQTPFSFWRGTFTATIPNERPDVIEKEGSEELFRRLIEEDEEHTDNTRYILAVMLERQKLLRETDSQRTPTGILRIYEHRKTGEVYIIRDPNIPLAQIETLQTEVIQLLETGGRPPEPELPETPEESTPEESAAEDPTRETLPDAPN